MAGNKHYAGPRGHAGRHSGVPAGGSASPAARHMPLNIFEPRYLAMIDHALAGDRLIGMVQPNPDKGDLGGYTRRLRRPDHAIRRDRDGRYIVSLTGVARFRLMPEVSTSTPFLQYSVDWTPFTADYEPKRRRGRGRPQSRDRGAQALFGGKQREVDWDSVKGAANEALVNALCMMSPYGVRRSRRCSRRRT